MMRQRIWWGIGALAATACSQDGVRGEGDVRLVLSAEASITRGIAVGDEPENSRDYAVTYDKYLAVVGHVHLGREAGAHDEEDEATYLVDLTQVGEEGITLHTLSGVSAGQWREVGFSTPAAEAGLKVLDHVSEDDAEEMIREGYTYFIQGTVESDDGPVAFEIKTDAPTEYAGCELDGQPGVAVKADATTTVTFTLHGDHLWFDAFPVGEEAKIERRARWITLVEDVLGDGVIDTGDLLAADPTRVLAGYDLSGNPGGPEHPIDSVLEFARQQLATQGHYKGEGECAWTFAGTAGGHDHEH